jgi:DNA packaging protein Nu1
VVVIGQENIALLFGVSPKTIVEWQEQGFPIAQRGSPGIPSEYDSTECIRWYLERELRKISDESPNDRLYRVKADAIEMENTKRRKTLIPVDQLEPRLRAFEQFARATWQPYPARLAKSIRGLDDQEAEDVLAEAFAAFLVTLSRWPQASA